MTEEQKRKYENLTPDEVGEIFRRSAKTVKRWIEEGKYFDHSEVLFLDDSFLIPKAEVDRVFKMLKERTLEDLEETKEAAKSPNIKRRRGKGFVQNF